MNYLEVKKSKLKVQYDSCKIVILHMLNLLVYPAGKVHFLDAL